MYARPVGTGIQYIESLHIDETRRCITVIVTGDQMFILFYGLQCSLSTASSLIIQITALWDI